MRKFIPLLLVIFLCLPVTIYATCEGAAATKQKNAWELGTEISHITYKESGISEKGLMNGVFGAYTYRGGLPLFSNELDRYMLRMEGKYSYGKLNYEGPLLLLLLDPKIKNIPDYMLEFRGLLGYDFFISKFKASTFTPYMCFGYRYLNDHVPKRSVYGYERESNYFYSPIGLEVMTDLNHGWSWGANLEYDIFWWGEQVSHLSDISPLFNNPHNDQKKGYGIRGSIKIAKKCHKLDFIIEPFFRYWHIGDSKAATALGDLILPTAILGFDTSIVEPKNSSTEFGMKLGVKF
ncbi:MAG: hypothetical protein NT066_07985 [Candidatus Omnitrophica bacterium]|nr:hypothetical protein [Candidatus Omnitrophota bacterium]